MKYRMDGCFGGLLDGRGEVSGLSPTEINMLGSTGYGRRELLHRAKITMAR